MFSVVIYIQIYFDKYFKFLPFKFTKMNFNCFDWGADQISENCNFVVRILMKKIEGYRRVSRGSEPLPFFDTVQIAPSNSQISLEEKL